MERFLPQYCERMAAILIVDDDQNIRTSLSAFVESLGHTVETAPDGDSALAILSQRPFDLVLSDVCMQNMSGLALLRTLREQYGDVAVVLMSAYATVPQAVEAIRAGAYEYLAKPFAPDDVRLLINHVLDVQNLRREGVGSQHPAQRENGSADSLRDVTANPADGIGDLSLKDLERRRIEQAMAESATFEEAARRLGIDPTTLWRKRKRYGIS